MKTTMNAKSQIKCFSVPMSMTLPSLNIHNLSKYRCYKYDNYIHVVLRNFFPTLCLCLFEEILICKI